MLETMDAREREVSNEGERILLSDRPALVAEHSIRYHWVTQFLGESDYVLDCACGSGYGTEILARYAGNVVGVDISEKAIEYCREKQSASNINYVVGSAESLPSVLPPGSVDVFVSFETIEHIEHPQALLREAVRVLKPGGLFVVSTPNRVPNGLASGQKPANPFHVVEWSFREFHEVLTKQFQSLKYYGQRVRSPNKFHPKYVVSKVKRAFGMADFVALPSSLETQIQMENANSWQPENFIAVCRRV